MHAVAFAGCCLDSAHEIFGKTNGKANLMECTDSWCMQQAAQSLLDKNFLSGSLSVARWRGGKKTQKDCV
jgi:hypothetical protein